MRAPYLLLLSTALAVSLGHNAAAATVYNLVATPDSSNPSVSAFSFSFEDLDGDLLASLDEVLDGTFSGVTSFTFGFFPELIIVADVDGFADGGGLGGAANETWRFFDPALGNFSASADLWAYQLTPATPVPLGPSVLLLLSALPTLRLLGAGRRRR